MAIILSCMRLAVPCIHAWCARAIAWGRPQFNVSKGQNRPSLKHKSGQAAHSFAPHTKRGAGAGLGEKSCDQRALWRLPRGVSACTAQAYISTVHHERCDHVGELIHIKLPFSGPAATVSFRHGQIPGLLLSRSPGAGPFHVRGHLYCQDVRAVPIRG